MPLDPNIILSARHRVAGSRLRFSYRAKFYEERLESERFAFGGAYAFVSGDFLCAVA
jgi:hypothetical protein